LVYSKQGDQIWQIFAYWAIVFFGQFIENYTSGANSWAAFYHSPSYVLILTKNWMGDILGGLFTNSSGHPHSILSFGVFSPFWYFLPRKIWQP
jgi:hypothetical protein